MNRLLLTMFTAFSLIAPAALADSISPATFSATLAVGESTTIRKTVTVDAGRPTSALVDVKFISDTTGSMGGIINSVRTEASTIMSNLSGLGDLTFGASEYRDLGDTFTTRVNQSLTADTTAVQTGINAWSASGGGDTPEANLIALTEQAEAADWRAGSNRFIVQFGDAPGHEGGAYPTLAEATTSLTDNNVTLLVVGTAAMNIACGDCTANAATTLAEATGGSFNLLGGGVNIADIIDDAITAAFAEYDEVSLELIGLAPGVGITVDPVSITGDFDRSIARTFEFDVTFTGLMPGVYDFGIGAFVDGGQVATEADRITVVGDAVIPLPATLPLMLGALGVGGMFLRRRRTA